jgi:putative Ca2+/H+ antiporter (TMEM165/GDT1 family)
LLAALFHNIELITIGITIGMMLAKCSGSAVWWSREPVPLDRVRIAAAVLFAAVWTLIAAVATL